MAILLNPIIIALAFALYWLNRERRKNFREKTRGKTLYNLYRVARNISFMLTARGGTKITGNAEVLRKGGILYSFHFGVWELMPQILTRTGYRLGVITNRYGADNENTLLRVFDRFLYNWRSRNGVNVFYKEDTPAIIKFIKGGGIFGILVDGNTLYAKYNKAEKLAKICGVPLVPFAVCREKDASILQLNCDLNAVVKQRPFDYMWFYKSRH